MKLNDVLFELMHTVRNTMMLKLKSLHPELSPMHFKSLKVITKVPECTGQKLAERMGRDKAQINRLLKELVTSGLITKTENKKDKRSQLLELTTGGLEIMAGYKKVETEVFDSLIQDITPQELKQFIYLSEKLKTNLIEMP
ncbi:MarR family winged helix-turn-helix transcriptional regulator [Paraglaciecola sp.]|uniref:MarR family winged helix-turn-helix transcriptional regulator n=1 Tax=Paraglaciecola sp. TaxID=1920173 RepID=UPI003EF4738F